jgi:TATA-binding protein-associated factor
MSAFTIRGFTEGFPEDMRKDNSTFGQSIIDEFSIVRTLLPSLHPSLVEQLREMYHHVVQALQCRYSVIRFAAARCFASMCKADLVAGMKYMVDNVLPMVTDQLDVKRRQGATECIYRIVFVMNWLTIDLVTMLDTEILPYVIFLIVPVMGRMSDSDNDVRLLATETFATLVKLVPLEVFFFIPIYVDVVGRHS